MLKTYWGIWQSVLATRTCKKGERNRDKKEKKELLRVNNDDRNKKDMLQERKEGKTNNLKDIKMLKEKR